MEDRVYPAYNANQNNGYKGFSHNYPLQQPESPPSPRRRRCRPCCCCCCWSLLIILVLLCVGVALVYFLLKPKVPKYTIDQATITLFNYSSQHHLTSDMRFVITAHNPNKHMEFFYKSLNVDVSYDGTVISQGSMPAFNQPHASLIPLPLQVRGRDVVMRGSAASNLKKSLANKSSLQLKLKAKSHLKVKIGSLKSWGQKVKIKCYLTISAPIKPGKVQILSNSCKLD